MKRTIIFTAGTLLAAGFSTAASVGVVDTVRNLLGEEGIVLAVAAGTLALAGGLFGTLFARVRRTFIELGEFLIVLGRAAEDKRITGEELAEIVREGRDILDVWKK